MMFLGILGDIGELFVNGLRSLLAIFCEFIYNLISSVYALFMYIAEVRILTSETIVGLYNRITIILTTIMVFYITFEFVKYVVEPDKLTDNKVGASNVLTRAFLVVVLIAFTPKIFNLAYKVQNTILHNDIFSVIILNKKGIEGAEYERLGQEFSANILGMFYQVDEEAAKGAGQSIEKLKCGEIECFKAVNLNLESLRQNGKLLDLGLGLNEKTENIPIKVGNTVETIDKYNISFNGYGLFPLLVGIFILYVFIIYCIDVGVRVFQMAYLQIMAPIPIISYISPKDDSMFKKWVQQCITTYLDLFIRVAIIYFILLVTNILTESYNSGTLINNVNEDFKISIYIALIIGLLLFAKKAPKLIEELFPSLGSAAAKGNFGFRPKVASKAAGAALGGLKGAKKMMGRGINRAKRNRELRNKRLMEGKDPSRRAVRQERRQARKDAAFAKSEERNARKKLNSMNSATRKEQNAVLAAEKKVREAQRGGTEKQKTDALKAKEEAQQKLLNAQNAFARNNNKDLQNARNAQDLASIKASQATAGYHAALNADDAHRRAITEQRTAQTALETLNRNKDNIDRKVTTATENRTAKQQELASANADLEKVKSAGDEKISAIEKQIADAKNAGNQSEVEKLQKNLDAAKQEKETKVAEADAKVKDKEKEVSAAEASYSSAIEEQTKNSQEIEKIKQNFTTAEETIKTREKEIGDKTGYTTAMKEKEEAKTKYETLEKETTGDSIRNTNITKQQESQDAQSAYFKAANESYGSVITATAGGLVTGVATGVWEGGKVEKFGDIHKQMKTVDTKIKEQISKEEKYLDEGGSDRIIDRVPATIETSVKKHFGVITDSQISNMTNKNLESQIASNKRSMQIEGTVKTSLDAANDRVISKLEAGEEKTKISIADKDNLIFKDATGRKLRLSEYLGTDSAHLFDGNHTSSELVQAVNNNQTALRSAATAQRQALENARNDISVEEYNRRNEAVKKAENKAAQAEQLSKTIKKSIGHAVIDKVLGMDVDDATKASLGVDAVLDSLLVETNAAIQEARKDKTTYDAVLIELADNTEAKLAFMRGKAKTYSEADAIQVALTNVQNRLKLRTTSIENLSSSRKENAKMSADQAIDNITGSGK